MTPAQRARAAEHLRELGRSHNIAVRYVSTWEKSGAMLRKGIVYVPRIENPIDYLCGLHEFGHFLYGPSRKRHVDKRYDDIALEMTCEAAAWGWAIRNVDHRAVPRMTQRLRSQIGACWTSFFCERDFRPSTVKV